MPSLKTIKERILQVPAGTMRVVIIPEANQRDLADIPAQFSVELVTAKTIERCFNEAFVVGAWSAETETSSDLPVPLQAEPIGPNADICDV